MSGVIFLIILVSIVFFFLLLMLIIRTSEQQKLMEALLGRIKQLGNEITNLTNEIKGLKKPVIEKNVEQEPLQEKSQPQTARAVIHSNEGKKEEIKQEAKKAAPAPITFNLKKEEPVKIAKELPDPAHKEKSTTDLEKFIGENLANKIGIAVLVLGISFFVKYAIDKDWINETGRVIIGLIAGGILIAMAHRIRNNYRSFSSVLVGGGLTIFYFTIAFAFHQYHLISPTACFIIMAIITGFAVVLSLFYDRLELAVLATIGGFITPFLVNTGQDNYIALFSYLCILNAGIMVLAWFKRWYSINMIALFFTTIIFGGWLINKIWFEYPANFQHTSVMLFATVYYLQFIAMNIENNIREKKRFTAFNFIVVLSVNFLFYLAGMFILDHWNAGKFQGIFTAFLGLFNLLLVLWFRQKKSIDRSFVALVTGLSLTFISLTAPVQFNGNFVTLYWAAEAVILFWLYQKNRIIQLKIASAIIAVVMIGSLFITWMEVYFPGSQLMPVLLNKGFTTTFTTSVSLFIYYRLMYKEADTFYLDGVTNSFVRNFLFLSFLVTLYLSGAFEIFYQFSTRFSIEYLFNNYLQLYSLVFAISLFYLFKKDNQFPLLKFLMTILCLVLYLLHIKHNYEVSLDLIKNGNGVHFAAHWISIGLLIWIIKDFVVYFRKMENISWKTYLSSFTWLAAISTTLILSAELYQVNLWFNYRDEADWSWWENLYYKAGLSILWGLCSFIFMWLGMHYRFRILRLISLSLFSVTLLKLFFYDIRNIPPGGKIAAFILLGVLLLTVSFMYQQLKKIITDDMNMKKEEINPD